MRIKRTILVSNVGSADLLASENCNKGNWHRIKTTGMSSEEDSHRVPLFRGAAKIPAIFDD